MSLAAVAGKGREEISWRIERTLDPALRAIAFHACVPVTPAKAGVQEPKNNCVLNETPNCDLWIAALAGTTSAFGSKCDSPVLPWLRTVMGACLCYHFGISTATIMRNALFPCACEGRYRAHLSMLSFRRGDGTTGGGRGFRLANCGRFTWPATHFGATIEKSGTPLTI